MTKVTIKWNKVEVDDLAGYRIYQSGTGEDESYEQIAEVVVNDLDDADSPTYTIEDIGDGTYYWGVSAFDTSGLEGEKSDPVSAHIDTVPPPAPGGLIILRVE